TDRPILATGTSTSVVALDLFRLGPRQRTNGDPRRSTVLLSTQQRADLDHDDRFSIARHAAMRSQLEFKVKATKDGTSRDVTVTENAGIPTLGRLHDG